ncbi:MAG: DUF3488 domain-containing transglutaminase family protein [Magnetococcales bacterium]|nr:DUF3488 domain-containing transglutaminase family protein [Magnetococcales bacterium]
MILRQDSPPDLLGFPPAPWVLQGLLGLLVLVAAPHVPNLPPGLILLCGTLGIWWLVSVRKTGRPPAPGMLIRATVVVAASLLVWAEYGRILGQNSGVALLTSLLFLKLLEFNSRRDPLLVILLCNFLTMTHFFHSQSIWMGGYAIAVTWLSIAALISLHHPGPGVVAILKKSGVLLLQAVPVMVVLFLLFPRIAQPLWGLPADAFSTTGTIGLSDSMSPGSVTNLIAEGGVAFRATFDKKPPPIKKRYWRGPVLWVIWPDGVWRTPGTPLPRDPITIEPLGPTWHYSVTMEPTQDHWLFALDLPVEAPEKSGLLPDFQLKSHLKVSTTKRYRIASIIDYRAGVDLHPDMWEQGLQLPFEGNRKTRQLAQKWSEESDSDEEIVERALELFRQEPFIYTLTPPLQMGKNRIDQFLFETRKGFCEHYAGAFTYLMRAADIPARVVLGYQGGKINPLGNHLTVRNADAHAWSEVWLAGRGWVRVDPTAAVAPERIERGLSAAMNQRSDELPFLLRPNREWLENIWSTWDLVDNGWNQWVLGFNVKRQARFLSGLGLGELSYRGMALGLAAGVGGLFGLFALIMLRPGLTGKGDPVVKLYQRLQLKLAKKGVSIHPNEGPMDYAARAARHLPQAKAPIDRFIHLYVALRYRERQMNKGVRLLKRLLGRIDKAIS